LKAEINAGMGNRSGGFLCGTGIIQFELCKPARFWQFVMPLLGELDARGGKQNGQTSYNQPKTDFVGE
jgi:hypothetical protein